MPQTSRRGLPYPDLKTSPNGPAQLQALAAKIAGEPAPRGYGASFPTDAIQGDTYYHTTYRCFMGFMGSAAYWKQMGVTEVVDEADRLLFQSRLASAGLLMHNGFIVHQADTDQRWVCTGSAAGILTEVWSPAERANFSNATVNGDWGGEAAASRDWQGFQNFSWEPKLGAKVFIPRGVARDIKVIGTANLAGDMWLRIRADYSDNTTKYFPSPIGKRSVTGPNQEQDITILGRFGMDSNLEATVYLQARAEAQGSGAVFVPQLLIL